MQRCSQKVIGDDLELLVGVSVCACVCVVHVCVCLRACAGMCLCVVSPVLAEAVTQRHSFEGGAALGVWPACSIRRASIETDDTLQKTLTAERQGHGKKKEEGERETVRKREREE